MRIATFVSFSTVVLIAGCAGSGEDAALGDSEMNASRVSPELFNPETIKLYSSPNATPNQNCDVHTKLNWSENGAKVHLEEAAVGMCPVASAPNPRDYELEQANAACGSRTYTGTLQKGGETWSIKITDHRVRTCEDLVPAKLIVEETTRAGRTTKYSYDQPSH